MLNEREQEALAGMERHLRATDPAFVRRFARLGRTAVNRVAGAGRLAGTSARSMHSAGAAPSLLLAAGLVLMIFGGVTAMAPVAVGGMTLAALALFIGYTATAQDGAAPGFA